MRDAVAARPALDARTKLLVTFLAVAVCVSTPPAQFWVFGAYFVVLAVAIAAARVSVAVLLRRIAVAVPVAACSALLIPFLPAQDGGAVFEFGGLHVSHAGLLILWNVLAKSCFGVACLVLLAETTPFAELMPAMQRLRFPAFALMITGMTHRYLFVLGDEARRMMRARDARGYRGRGLWDARIIGNMIGALFLRAFERGERIHLAMAARGFRGPLPVEARPLHPRDYGFLAGMSMLLLGLRAAAL